MGSTYPLGPSEVTLAGTPGVLRLGVIEVTEGGTPWIWAAAGRAAKNAMANRRLILHMILRTGKGMRGIGGFLHSEREA